MTLKNIRKNKGITLNELASATGLNAGYLCHIERGTRTNPSKDTMEKIASALGRTVSEVFYSEDEHNEKDHTNKQ